jgi:glycine/D-amino acid oxidase-like deaminating enzyme
MEKSAAKYDADVLIVGLGCVGISTAFNCTKNGLKVIGFERHSDTGAIGTASYGHTRIWRTSHNEQRYNLMQEEALVTWREMEQRTGQQILTTTGLLWILHPGSELYKFVSSQGGGEKLTNSQMKARWPGLIGMPNDFVGFFAHHAGVVKAHVGLMACKKLSLEQGADLRYNSEVKSVDIKNGIVELESGQKYHGKNVVISCGPFTE